MAEGHRLAGKIRRRDPRLIHEFIPRPHIADGRDFVSGIGVLDAEARTAGVVAISGAFSVPALSGAVVRALGERGAAPRHTAAD